MHASTRSALIALCALSLSGCPRPVRPPEPAAPVPAEPTGQTRGSTAYDVVSRDSTVSIFVYRGGTLSRLGHNHVVTSHSLRGRLWINPQLAQSGFELSFPVQELTVDEPEARRAAGPEFSSEVSAADKEGTRKNMLRDAVLDADQYPNVTLRSVKISGSLASAQVVARITLRNTSRDVQVPAAVKVDGQRVVAKGEFDILQTEFGIKPFSIALGALEVQDRLHIRYSIAAERAAAT
jgi:polyisoprenoid-binding protein YceI